MTKLSTPKTWKPGTANEVWKVAICARDASIADDLLKNAANILTDCGSDYDAGLDKLREMTGEQIISGIQAYAQSCLESVRAGLKTAS